jgi:hypothetical protein
VRRTLIGLFWAALVFACVMATLPRPPQLPGAPSDKVQHILAFTALTALALGAYPRAPPLRIGLWLALVGGAIELVQMIPMLNRDGAWLDWAADCGAILVILSLGVPLRRRLLRRVSPAP